MVNQVTPTGNLTYNKTGESSFVDSSGKTVTTPTYTATTTLSPEQQAIFDQTQKAQTNLAGLANDQSAFLKDYLSKPVDLSRAGLQGYIDQNYGVDFNNTWDKNQEAQRTQLISSGIRPGTPAYDAAMREFSNNRSKAYDNLLSDTYSTALQSKLAERNQPINEISSLLSGSQITAPQFTSTPQTGVGGVDYTSLVNNKYNADVQNSKSTMGGLFGLLSTPFSFLG